MYCTFFLFLRLLLIIAVTLLTLFSVSLELAHTHSFQLSESATMMHMTFYWGKEVTILFTSWKTTTWLNYSLSLLACLIAPVLYQLLENQRIRLKLAAAGKSSAPADGIETPLLLESKISGGKWSAAKILGAVLFGINAGIGYLLMLAVMSFNGGVFIAVVLGLAIGYFLFRTEDEELKVVGNPCGCA